MTFPSTPLDTHVEFWDGTQWVDIVSPTNYVYSRDGVAIKRGKSNEAGEAEPSMCHLTLNNRDGRFSPRNPTGPYFGLIGRNTPLRVYLPGTGSMGLQQMGTSEDASSTPDAATLDITGDIDLRVDVSADSWRNAYSAASLVSKYNDSTPSRSYILYVSATGAIGLQWSNDGTTIIYHESTALIPVRSGRISLRATLDVDNGASGHTTTFYYSTTAGVAGPWTQLGSTVVTAGTTSIFSGTSRLYVGDRPRSSTATNQNTFFRRFYAAEVRNGIAGTVVANPNFTIQAEGTTSFADTAAVPKTWTLNANAVITARDYRFWGEVAQWPAKWDTTGSDVWVEVEASGLLRRLGQGAPPLLSTMRRYLQSRTDVVAYWPAEDQVGSQSISSAVSAGKSMTVVGTPDYAAYTGAFASTAPIPTLNNSRWKGNIPTASSGAVQFGGFLRIESGLATNTVIAQLTTTGTLGRTDLVYAGSGDLQLLFWDSDGVSLSGSAVLPYSVDSQDSPFTLTLVQNGADIDWTMTVATITATILSYSFTTSSVAGKTVGRGRYLAINPNGVMDQSAIGQLFITSTSTSLLFEDAADSAVLSYAGEYATNRIIRASREAGIPVRVYGTAGSPQPMGPQGVNTFLGILKECEDVDQGMLFEERGALCLAYRTRAGLFHQTAKAAASYTGKQVMTLEPVEDDQRTRNDITVTRAGGGYSRLVRDSGALSTTQPPNGVGTYADALDVNVQLDAQTEPIASWRLNLGTVDQARYPVIDFNYTTPEVLADSTLTAGLDSLDVGDRVTVANPPAWGARETISQLVIGYEEFLNNFERTVKVNGQPGAVPDAVGAYSTATSSGAGQSKYGARSTIAAATSSQTTFTVTTASGRVWTTDAAEHPREMIVGGERVTVTATSGTTSPQTFTVTRSVNGVVKAQTASTKIALFNQPKYGL